MYLVDVSYSVSAVHLLGYDNDGVLCSVHNSRFIQKHAIIELTYAANFR